MKKTTMLVGLAAVLLTGCIRTNSVLFDPTVRFAPVRWEEVRIFMSAEDVPWEYEEIALVHAKGDDDWTDEADLIEAIREEAAELGAHGVILEWMEEPSAAERIADHFLHDNIAQRRGRAIAIRWVETVGS